MSASFEKSVKGATKHKCAAPKAKYVEHILIATHAGEAGIAEVFRAINIRLRESVWTTVFKALIVVHYMIREGEPEVTLRYMKRNPRIVSLSHYSDAQIQGRNIRNYSHYLSERARAYGDVRTDYVRSGEGRLRKLSVEKGLLREVECVQGQIRALLACQFLDGDIDNEITLLAFRLLVSDLLVLFHVVNEGVINVLEHYFEMSRYDAERALQIYKVFTRQTAEVVEYLQQARMAETSTRLQIPNLQHAPTSLTSSLEEYLHDPDFEINRRQYLAQQQAKKGGGKAKPASSSGNPATTSSAQNGTTATAPAKSEPPKIAPDLIDFFESIESDAAPMFAPQQQPPQQMPMYAQPTGPNPFPGPVMSAAGPMQPMPTAFAPQNTVSSPFPLHQTGPAASSPPSNPSFQPQSSPFQPIQPTFTGAGFGGYSPQNHTPVTAPPMPAIPQQFLGAPGQQQFSPPQQQFSPPQFSPPQQTPLQIPQHTNPFRASMLAHASPSSPNANIPPRTSPSPGAGTNPFARPQTSAGVVPQRTGTNPFNRGAVSPSATGGPAGNGGGMLMPTATGSGVTNPFRASIMMQQREMTQQGAGVIDQVPTVPVFPRQGQQGQGWPA